MKSLTFFNNKGGVGKTTLACNMASYFARDMGLKTLVVDCDPQCNSTQLLLPDEDWIEIYSEKQLSEEKTVLKVLSNIRAGDSSINADVQISHSPRFGVDVLPGHPTLSVIEDKLSQSWNDFKSGDLGGARRTRWVASLVNEVDYDLVVFDVGPSLGALNRSVLVGTDRFVTPMSSDLFSLYSLDNIHDWVTEWADDYDRAVHAVQQKHNSTALQFGVEGTAKIRSAFSGYTVQQYAGKRMQDGHVRAVAAFEQFATQIPYRAKALADFGSPSLNNPALGVIPNMFSMIPLAQSAHAPIRDLRPADGVRGAQVTQQKNYSAQLEQIAKQMASSAGITPRTEVGNQQ